MTDYTVAIGGSTTMMIRDTGGNVEFWIKTGSLTYNYQQTWSYFANGANSPVLQFRMVKGGNWQHFGTVYVGYDQDVRFTIYNTGLGFPTHDFWVHIQRSTVPQSPTMLSATATSDSSFHVLFSGNADGGSPVLQWQIGYGSNPNAPEALSDSNGTSDLGGFTPGQRVYFWARARNAVGWSQFGNRLDATTWRVPDPPNPVVVVSLTQTEAELQFTNNYDGGTPIIWTEIGYGTSPTVPLNSTVNNSGRLILDHVSPGATYYFWSRVQNAVGWSDWSSRVQVDFVAGARVLVGVTWKRAVPYVRVGGVWKVARPWVRDAGVWKETPS